MQTWQMLLHVSSPQTSASGSQQLAPALVPPTQVQRWPKGRVGLQS